MVRVGGGGGVAVLRPSVAPPRRRDLVRDAVQVRSGRLPAVGGRGGASIHTGPALRLPEVKEFPGVEGLAGRLGALLGAAPGRRRRGGRGGGRRRGGGGSGGGGDLLPVLGRLEELEAQEARQLGLVARGRLRRAGPAPRRELALQRDDLLQPHHVVVGQQRAGPLRFVAAPASTAAAATPAGGAGLASMGLVVVVVPPAAAAPPGGTAATTAAATAVPPLALAAFPLAAGGMLRLPLALLLLPLPALQLLVVLLRLPLVLLQPPRETANQVADEYCGAGVKGDFEWSIVLDRVCGKFSVVGEG